MGPQKGVWEMGEERATVSLAWTFKNIKKKKKRRSFERAVLKIFGPGWTGVLENTAFIWSKMDKHAKCIITLLSKCFLSD